MQNIDTQIHNILNHFDQIATHVEEEPQTAREQEMKAGLLNGPQSADDAVKQDDIDSLFA